MIITLVDFVFYYLFGEGGAGGALHLRDSLCDFEDPQQPDAPEDGEAEGSHGADREHDHLQDAAKDHEEVEAVEEGHEVGPGAQRVHLHKHLDDEQHQQHTAGHVWWW